MRKILNNVLASFITIMSWIGCVDVLGMFGFNGAPAHMAGLVILLAVTILFLDLNLKKH